MSPLNQARLFMRQGIEAYQQKDFARALDLLMKARTIRPDHPGIVYNLGALHALTGNTSEALRNLNIAASMGVIYHPERDSDFVSVWETDNFKELQRLFQENMQPKGTVHHVYQLREKELITEGLAYDRLQRSFYVSSIRKRKIIRVGPEGKQRVFSQASDSLWAPMGLCIDPLQQKLWVATSALPQMEGFREELLGRAAIVQYDLGTQTLSRRWEIPSDARDHLFGDLTVTRRGEVYITDALTPSVYRITAGGFLELFITIEDAGSLQGIAFSDDETRLYLSDYSRGIWVVDPVSRTPRLLTAPSGQTLLSIDGLYFYRNSLIGTQNDIQPNRVVRLFLGSDGSSITELTVLSANNRFTDEPTLGVVVEDDFYFNGNSQWKYVDANGAIRPQAVWEPHWISKVVLQ